MPRRKGGPRTRARSVACDARRPLKVYVIGFVVALAAVAAAQRSGNRPLALTLGGLVFLLAVGWLLYRRIARRRARRSAA